MATIKNPVGKKPGPKGNELGDVMVVQALLNKFIIPGYMLPFQPLVIDGNCGKVTKAAIVWFQLNVMGWAFPDGRVDPGGKTLAELNGPLKGPFGPPKTPPKPEPEPEVKPVNKSDPVKITNPAKYAKLLRSPDTVHTSWDFYPTISPGQVYSLYTGNRIVLTGRHDGVIYLLDTKEDTAGMYRQDPIGFTNDVAADAFIRVGHRSAILQTMARAEVIFLAGIVCGANGAALFVSISLSALEFVGEHKKDIPNWAFALDQVLKARKVLKQYAPTLLEVIEDQLFDTTCKALAEGTIYNQDYIAQSIGVSIGIVGNKAWKQKFSVGSILLSMLTFVCGRAISAAISTLKYLPAQIEADATKLYLDLKASGFDVPKMKVLKIVQEVAANPIPIKQTLTDLKAAFIACT